MWSTGEQNGKPLQYSCLENPMKIGHCKMNSPGQQVPNMLLEITGEITPERIEMEPKQKQHPVVDVTGDGSKV